MKTWARSATSTPVTRRHCSATTPESPSWKPAACRSHFFSHATQSASTCGLVPGAALLLVSRGVIEASHNDQEFGLEGAKKSFQGASALSAQDLCLEILQSAEQFLEAAPTHNDVTALVLLALP